MKSPLSVTPEREAEIRRLSAGWVGDFALRDTLVALDEARARVSEIEAERDGLYDALDLAAHGAAHCAAMVCGR